MTLGGSLAATRRFIENAQRRAATRQQPVEDALPAL
jgi:hypothetical protein